MKWNPAYTPGPWKSWPDFNETTRHTGYHCIGPKATQTPVAVTCADGTKDDAALMKLAPELAERLHACDIFFREVLPKFNWGASALDAKAIRTLNELPGEVAKLLARVPQKP